MKTQNRPELKVGDRVRFRSDGEIGELNRSQNLNTEIFHTVKKICTDGRVYHEAGGSYAQVQFDICNDFSDIQVGDKVERYWKDWKHKITTDTVESVSENEFMIGCGLSISKADGIQGNFRDIWSILRIVEKAKPKPLLADAKVGDLCKLKNGYWTQIKDIASEGGFDYVCENGHSYTVNGVHNLTSPDIVYWEPLAPEGTAEWAWQMLNLLRLPIYHPTEGVLTIRVPYSSDRFAHCYAKTGWQIYTEPEPKESPIDPIERPLRNLILLAKEQGMNIRTWYQDLIFTPESLTSYLSNGRFRWWNIGDWELTKREANMTMPEPEYKAGDFIKDGDNYYIVTSPTTCVGLLNGKGYEICPKTGKIVSPSEEVLDFGNGVKGTVRSCVVVKPSEVMVYMDCIKGVVTKPLQDYGKDIFWLYYSADEYISIPFDALDESTRKMVKSLLKAQEEK